MIFDEKTCVGYGSNGVDVQCKTYKLKFRLIIISFVE